MLADRNRLNAKEAAEYLEETRSARTIKEYARRYKSNPDDSLGLRGLKTPRGWRFKREWLDDWMERYSGGRRK